MLEDSRHPWDPGVPLELILIGSEFQGLRREVHYDVANSVPGILFAAVNIAFIIEHQAVALKAPGADYMLVENFVFEGCSCKRTGGRKVEKFGIFAPPSAPAFGELVAIEKDGAPAVERTLPLSCAAASNLSMFWGFPHSKGVSRRPSACPQPLGICADVIVRGWRNSFGTFAGGLTNTSRDAIPNPRFESSGEKCVAPLLSLLVEAD